MHSVTRLRKALKVLLFTAAVNCGLAHAEITAADAPQTSATSNINITGSGVYLGFTPCDDCKGIKTELVLNQNNSYVLMTTFIGKSEREFVEKGKYVAKDNDIITLTSKDGRTTRHYLVGENSLTQLNENAEHINGVGADRYILQKKNVVKGGKVHHRQH